MKRREAATRTFDKTMTKFTDQCRECGSNQLRVDGGCPVCMECGFSPCG